MYLRVVTGDDNKTGCSLYAYAAPKGMVFQLFNLNYAVALTIGTCPWYFCFTLFLSSDSSH